MEQGQSIAAGIQAMCVSTFLVYALLFGTGYFLYGEWIAFGASLTVAIVSGILLVRIWPKLKMDE